MPSRAFHENVSTKHIVFFRIFQDEVKTAAMDHHGLVAALCHDLKIAEKIDRRLSPDFQRKVSPGIASITMIINGLGFTNRTLYLTHRFFKSKPVELLLGKGLEAKDLTDHTPSTFSDINCRI